MFDHSHYVPIVKGKQGEYAALKGLNPGVRLGMTPLVELPPVTADPDEWDTEAVEPGLKKTAAKLEASWGTDQRLFIDAGLVPSAPALTLGEHPAAYVLSRCRELAVLAVPVTNPRRDDDHQTAVAEAMLADGRGCAIRLDNQDFDDLAVGATDVLGLVEQLDTSFGDVDLIIDLRTVAPDQEASMFLAATAVLGALPDITAWRSLTLAGTAFPDVASFAALSTNRAPRTEWALWRRLLARASSLGRMPTLGDYAVNGEQPVTTTAYRSSPNLRYTTDDEWIVLKARGPKYGNEQFYDLCRELIDMPEYRGKDFSEGDAYFWRCAHGQDGPGQGTTWRRAATSHHLVAVVDQLTRTVAA